MAAIATLMPSTSAYRTRYCVAMHAMGPYNLAGFFTVYGIECGKVILGISLATIVTDSGW